MDREKFLDKLKWACDICRDTGWVCEDHPNYPAHIDVEGHTHCVVGMPCKCNKTYYSEETPLRFSLLGRMEIVYELQNRK